MTRRDARNIFLVAACAAAIVGAGLWFHAEQGRDELAAALEGENRAQATDRNIAAVVGLPSVRDVQHTIRIDSLQRANQKLTQQRNTSTTIAGVIVLLFAAAAVAYSVEDSSSSKTPPVHT